MAMLRRGNYDLVDEDGYDMRIPAVSEEAFQYGIVFKLKYVGSLDIPRPSSRTDIISAMRRIRCEYKLRSAKKKKVVMIVSVDGIKIFARKAKSYSSRRLLTPFLRRDHSASSVLSTPSSSSYFGRNGRNNQQLTRASSAVPLSSTASALKSVNNSVRSCVTEPGGPNASAEGNNDGNLQAMHDEALDGQSQSKQMTTSISSSINAIGGGQAAVGTGLPEDEPPLFHHQIHRIFFVSHYSPDERVFSYIARNGSSQHHQQEATAGSVLPCPFTCYVFKTYKKSEAIRIVRTIGQSFEVCHNLSQKMAQKQKQQQPGQSASSSSASLNKAAEPSTKQANYSNSSSSLNQNSAFINSAITAALNYAGANNSNGSVRARQLNNGTSSVTVHQQQQPVITSSTVCFPMSSSLYTVVPDISISDINNGSCTNESAVERSQSMRQLGAGNSSTVITVDDVCSPTDNSGGHNNTTDVLVSLCDSNDISQQDQQQKQAMKISTTSSSLSATSTLTTMSPCQIINEAYNLNNFLFGNNGPQNQNVKRKKSTGSNHSSDGTFTNDDEGGNNNSANSNISGQAGTSSHLLITNNANNSNSSPLLAGTRSVSIFAPPSLFGSSSDARMAVFQRMLELQRQENEASLAQAERLRQQLLAECDARQAAQQRNHQLLRQNCELVDKLTQLFDRLERVEKSLANNGNSAAVTPNRTGQAKQTPPAILAPSPQTSSLFDDFDFDMTRTDSSASTNATSNNRLPDVLVPKINPPPPKTLILKSASGNSTSNGGGADSGVSSTSRRTLSTWQQHRQATCATAAPLTTIDNNLDNIITNMMQQQKQPSPTGTITSPAGIVTSAGGNDNKQITPSSSPSNNNNNKTKDQQMNTEVGNNNSKEAEAEGAGQITPTKQNALKHEFFSCSL